MIRHILTTCLMIVAVSTMTPALSAETNVTGTWSVSLLSSNGKRETTMVLAQKDKALTGEIGVGGVQSPVTGTIEGNAVKISYLIGKIVRPPEQGGERLLTIDYVGTVTGDTITAEANSKEYGRVQMKGLRKR
jgi:autotransporter translocation and assembly factor TamB